MYQLFRKKIHIEKSRKINRTAFVITVLTFGVLGSIIIGLSRAATPSSGFTNVLDNPINPTNLTNIPFGTHSDWVQPWRAYMDTVPSSTFLNAVGINFNVSGNSVEPTARLLAANGFTRARIELPWNNIDYNDPTKLTAAAQQNIQQKITTFKKYGIRPLIVLNANSGGPVPAQTFTTPITLTQPAKIGDTTIKVDPAVIPQITLNYSGSNFTDSDGAQAKYRFTSVMPDGTITLSFPLRVDVPAGVYKNVVTQKFQPFFPPTKDDGSPSPYFNETMNGWLQYVGATTKAVKQYYGSDGFDVEIWNELSFGSAFLNANNYYSPMPAGYTAVSGQQSILHGTIDYIRNPANGVPNIKIGNGFTNQAPWGDGNNQPVGETAIDKHPYSGLLRRPVQGPGGHSIDATGQQDPSEVPTCVQTYDHTKPASFTDTLTGNRHNGKFDLGEVCSGDTVYISPFEPAYNRFLPESFLTGIQTETLIRDLAPFPNTIGGDSNCVPSVPLSFNDRCMNIHGRGTKPCPTCAPLELWITEVNLPPAGYYDPVNPSLSYPKYNMDAVEKRHVASKNYLRYLTAWINKGVTALDFYAVTDGDFSVVDQSYFDQLTAGDIKHNPSFYPGDSSGGESLAGIKNLTDIMKQGTAPLSQPRQLTLDRIADNHNHSQFKGNGTAQYPDLYNRDVLAVLPFQVNNQRFVIPAYVMTLNTATIYNNNAPAGDVSRFDMPPEAYQITMGGFDSSKTYTASAVDPLTNTATPVSIVSQSGGTLVIQADLTDSPRVLIIDGSGTGTPPPSDTTNPTVSLTAPASGATVSGSSTAVSATAADDTAVVGVQFKLDGNNLGTEDISSPYSVAWATTSATNGIHTLTAVARDAAGNSTTSASRTVTVSNTPADTTPPDTTITANPVNPTVNTGASFSFTSSESNSTFECRLDGASFTSCTSPKTYTNLSVGSHTFSVRAIDSAGNQDASADTYTWIIATLPDSTNPTVSFSSPTNGSTISGVVTATAAASDNVAVTKVELSLDGSLKMTDTSGPYNYSFDSKTLANGPHTLSAKAYDAVGNTTTTTITVTVNNPDITSPNAPTNLNATAPNATTVNLTWTVATDTGANPTGVVKYNVLRNGVVIAQPTTTSYIDTNRVANTTYTYTVQAVDGSGNTSVNSNSKTITTPIVPDTTDPTVPGGLAATAVSINQVNLSWSTSTDSGGSGLAGYNIYRGSTKLNSTPITTTSYGDSALNADSTYTYKIEAVDGAGNTSAQTPAISAITPKIIRGDVTGAAIAPDGMIDLRDISYLIRKYNTSDASADISGPNGSPDGKVDLFDLSYIIRNYGK